MGTYTVRVVSRKPAPQRNASGYRLIYSAEPAPRLNPDGYLDQAWRIVSYVVIPREPGEHPMVIFRKVTARFQADGRDACERWARAVGVTLQEPGEVRAGKSADWPREAGE